MILTVVLVLCTISFMINALGEAKYYAHSGRYSFPIMAINLILAVISAGLLIYKLTGGS